MIPTSIRAFDANIDAHRSNVHAVLLRVVDVRLRTITFSLEVRPGFKEKLKRYPINVAYGLVIGGRQIKNTDRSRVKADVSYSAGF